MILEWSDSILSHTLSLPAYRVHKKIAVTVVHGKNTGLQQQENLSHM